MAASRALINGWPLIAGQIVRVIVAPVLPPLPAGFVYLLGADGAVLTGADGAYLYGAA